MDPENYFENMAHRAGGGITLHINHDIFLALEYGQLFINNADSKGEVPQPDIATTPGPHLTNYPPGAYEASMRLPDKVIWAAVESEPPVDLNA